MIEQGPAADLDAALLLRVWSEPGSRDVPRARLIDRGSGATVATAVGDAEIGREVLRWLDRLRTGPVPTPLPVPVPPLVDGDWPAAHPEVALLQVVDPSTPPPGAAALDWIRDLQDPDRRSVLDAGRFAALMDRLGITADHHVVLGGGRPALAAWAYWCFTYHGHPRVSLLDGSIDRPWTTLPPSSGYVAGPGRRELLVTRDQLLAGLVGAPPGTCLIDCRSAEEFAGRPTRPYDRPIDRHRVVGHLPGAVNLPAEELLDPSGRLLPLDRLRDRCAATGAGPDDQVVVHCGVNDRSGLVWFVLHELLGWPDVACYYGGWAEYASLADVPIERHSP